MPEESTEAVRIRIPSSPRLIGGDRCCGRKTTDQANHQATTTNEQSVRLFRYQNAELDDAVQTLLECDSLTDSDILEFCHGNDTPRESTDSDDTDSTTALYQARRLEIHRLLQLIPSGRARIDPTTGRLEAVLDSELNALPRESSPLPPLPVVVAPRAPPRAVQAAAARIHNDRPIHNPQPLPHLRRDNDSRANGNDNEQDPHSMAAAAIHRAVARYRAMNVDDDLRLVRVAAAAPPPLADAAELRPERERLAHPRAAGAGVAADVPPRPHRRAAAAEEPNDARRLAAAAEPRPRNRLERLLRLTCTLGAVLWAMVWAAVRTMNQYHGLSSSSSLNHDEHHDLLAVVAHVRHWTEQAQHCGGLPQLHRSSSNAAAPIPNRTTFPSREAWSCLTSPTRIPLCTRRALAAFRHWLVVQRPSRAAVQSSATNEEFDCSRGVLHIPSSATIRKDLFNNHARGQAFWWPHRINVAWFMPCRVPSATDRIRTWSETTPPPPMAMPLNQCFRGIHDGLIHDRHIREALSLGHDLVSAGGDHFDIHYNVQLLYQRLFSTLGVLEALLRDRYRTTAATASSTSSSSHVVTAPVPVAFRIQAVGPMDGLGIPGSRSAFRTDPLLRLFNRTRYMQLIESSKRQNRWAQHFRYLHLDFAHLGTAAVRDTCNLLADLQVDPSFLIQTTVYLSNGEGTDYSGGVAIYGDYDDESESQAPRHRRHEKIQRGASIDGSRGRVVVSTGGLENRRCRLPTRVGVRATLQIWWNYP
jgi:hypothetical protein